MKAMSRTFPLPLFFSSLSASKPLHPLNAIVLLNQTKHSYHSKTNVLAIHSKSLYSTNDVVSAVKPPNDGVLDKEIDDFSYEDIDGDEKDVLALKARNDVVLEKEIGDFSNEDSDEDEVEEEEIDEKDNLVIVNAQPPPSLSIKEKKELASYAHGLGKKLKSQQVGKSGVTATVITALIETLEKNELLKLKIHGNCPAELDDAIKQIEIGTGSVAVSQIGRTVILYRPSVSKLQAEQRKKLARRNLMKKRPAWVRSSSQSKEELPKLTARGRRGSSRV